MKPEYLYLCNNCHLLLLQVKADSSGLILKGRYKEIFFISDKNVWQARAFTSCPVCGADPTTMTEVHVTGTALEKIQLLGEGIQHATHKEIYGIPIDNSELTDILVIDNL